LYSDEFVHIEDFADILPQSTACTLQR
jgi:hypothetical protein